MQLNIILANSHFFMQAFSVEVWSAIPTNGSHPTSDIINSLYDSTLLYADQDGNYADNHNGSNPTQAMLNMSITTDPIPFDIGNSILGGATGSSLYPIVAPNTSLVGGYYLAFNCCVTPLSPFELFDFDNSDMVVSDNGPNRILLPTTGFYNGYTSLGDIQYNIDELESNSAIYDNSIADSTSSAPTGAYIITFFLNIDSNINTHNFVSSIVQLKINGNSGIANNSYAATIDDVIL